MAVITQKFDANWVIKLYLVFGRQLFFDKNLESTGLALDVWFSIRFKR